MHWLCMTDPMTRDQIDRLRALAEQATPGPWMVGTVEPCENCGRWHAAEARLKTERGDYGEVLSSWHPEIDGCMGRGRKADAEYIAACSPSVVLSLLAALDASGPDSGPDPLRAVAGLTRGMPDPAWLVAHAAELAEALATEPRRRTP